ncbi:pseudouridine synthase [Russula compacta]|nr:pseudouridine synthase [Russula compacta]
MRLGKASSVEVLDLGRRAATRRSIAGATQTRTGSRPSPGPGVLYVDRGLIVLNKPPGLVSQGTTSTSSTAVELDAKDDRPEGSSAFNDVLDDLRQRYGFNENPYPVHRLDKGTTGVLALARTKAFARELSRQFRTRAIEKTYLALVRGGADKFLASEGENSSLKREGLPVIDAPLSFDDGRVRIHRHDGSSSNLKAARTEWELLASSDVAPLSLVRLHPYTGLKHQLRVHMAHALGVPILGDALYRSPTTGPPVFALTGVPEGRLFLHSSSISIWRYRREGLHKRFRLTITAPLPLDFVKVCRDLNLDLPEHVTKGGAFVDGEHLEGDEIPGVGGQWLGKPFSV